MNNLDPTVRGGQDDFCRSSFTGRSGLVDSDTRASFEKGECCGMLENRSWENWIAKYSESHQHPLDRLTHTFGIPPILASLPMMAAGIFWRSLLWSGISLFILGWGLQFLGHAIEGKPPEFFSDWRFLLVGSRWWAGEAARKSLVVSACSAAIIWGDFRQVKPISGSQRECGALLERACAHA